MQPGPAGDAGSPPARPGRSSRPRRWRRPAAVLVLVLAVCGLGAATRGVLTQVMPRRFTAAQQRQIQAWEIGRRWRTLPESAIFPAAVPYQLPAEALNGGPSLSLTARRLGIAAAAGCAQGADAAAARVLAAYGCTTILRATYADATGQHAGDRRGGRPAQQRRGDRGREPAVQRRAAGPARRGVAGAGGRHPGRPASPAGSGSSPGTRTRART